MFAIRYKVFEDEELELEELRGADGYFEFQVVDETYGIYIPENIDVFSVSIYWWFYYFLEAAFMLNKTNYALICDIEKTNIWIELRKDGEELYISKVSADKPIGSTALESIRMPNLKYEYWKNKKVDFKNFKHEILKKSRKYLNDLKSLNVESHKDILNLEFLIQKVEKET